MLKYVIAFLMVSSSVFAQEFSRQDHLRGSITPERAWWDLKHYTLSMHVDVDREWISGTNVVRYTVLSEAKELQIDLQEPMNFLKATQNGKDLKVRKDGYSFFITTDGEQKVGETYELTITYDGKPMVPPRPPWDAGVTWVKDSNGKPFVANSNQGEGASVWWPNKDHGYDEPDDGILMRVEVREDLMDVSNGRLVEVIENPDRGTKTWVWKTVNPINNYGVNISVGDYVHFGEKYEGEGGTLDMDYYVLRENLEKAKTHFGDARRTIEAFEHWFGPYPFYEDGFKLVEVPYLGMEHQSAVTYGNKYRMGYLGSDLSGTGWGLKWDFIIIHEVGHEWFANNITAKDNADLWIHESFTNYSESLYTEFHFGKEAGAEYVRGTRSGIGNQRAIIGTYNVNNIGSSDMYPKGGNLLHTIRQILDDDVKWREILRGLNREFRHQTVTSKQIEDYIDERVPADLEGVFDQYLRDIRVPTLEYRIQNGTLRVRWNGVVSNFSMPIKAAINGKTQWLNPSRGWSRVQSDAPVTSFTVDKDFYVRTMSILGD